LALAFPEVDPGLMPFGSRVLVQIRRAPKKTASGLLDLPDEAVDTEKWNTQVAKVIAVGALAFKDRKTQQLWPEGQWAVAGDYVRTPKYGGDRWEIPTADGQGNALFVIFNDLDLIGKVTGDPLAVRAYV
jgi:co-chaperonin GroES (HSP10)